MKTASGSPRSRSGLAADSPVLNIVREEKILSIIGAGCAATSGLAILLHWMGVIFMPAAVSFISVPGGLALAVLGVVARKRHQQLFLHLLTLGTWAGLLGTCAYDGWRWLAQSTGWFSYDGFRAIPIFGSLMLGLPANDLAAQVAGWFYHFWNGISFGIFYALIAGPAKWPWGLAWGMSLEGLMILSYPALFGVPLSNLSFWAISLSGHAVYGTILGLLVQRYSVLEGQSRGAKWFRR